MKFFTGILTIYILLLSMFPCPEDVLSFGKEITTAVVDQMPADDDCEDECPPFCSCACCGVQMMRTCHCLHIKKPAQFAVYHPGMQTLSILDIYRPIWQPPQLS
ncbi:MAG: hypothetical protein GXC73_08450 [Chitinophagaceae bacterium]|nr:hypothetical protein [Chitinophagaceae bacterium]